MNQFLADALPYLFVFFLLDGFFLVPRGHVLFASTGGGRFRLSRSRVSFVFAWPSAEAYVVLDSPPLAGDSGVGFLEPTAATSEASPDDYTFVPFGETPFVADGKALLSGGARLTVLSSAEAASAWARGLEEIRRAPAPEREKKARAFLSARLSADSVRERREALDASGRSLGVWGTAVATLLFVVFPVHLAVQSPLVPVPVLLALLVGLVVVTVSRAARALKAWDVPSGERKTLAATLLLPSAATHPRLVIGKDLLASFDGAAVMAALLSEEELRREAQRKLSRLHLLAQRGGETPLGRAARLQAGVLEKSLAKEGLTKERVLEPPKPIDGTAAAYCPLCGAEYATVVEACVDCEAPLRSF